MFNLSGGEIIVILLLALVVLGPEKLPDAMRRAGRTWAELRKLSSGFQDEIRKGFEEPAREVKSTAAAVRSAASMGSDKKLRHNPATDPPPEMPPGNSVAEPSADERTTIPGAETAQAGEKAQEQTVTEGPSTADVTTDEHPAGDRSADPSS